MPLRTHNHLISFVAAALSVVALAASSVTFAQEAAKKPAAAATTGKEAGKVMKKAIEFMDKDDYKSARNLLTGIATEDLSPFDLSSLERIWFSIEYTEGNYAAARQHLQKSIDSGGMNESQISQARFQMAQIYIVEGNYKQGL